jgi:hypothetical protein
MKKSIFTILSLFFIAFVTNAQTIRRVNGDPTITGVNVYNTIQAAVNASNTNDIILIEPAGIKNENPNGYAYSGTVVVNKKVHIRGNGRAIYSSAAEVLPYIPYDDRMVQVDAFTFGAGSSGSSIKHCQVPTITIADSRILIENCEGSNPGIDVYLESIAGVFNADSVIIKKSRVSRVRFNHPNNATIVTYLKIQNCFLGYLWAGSGNLGVPSGAEIQNCFFSSPTFGPWTNSSIINSILYGPVGTLHSSNTISHCIGLNGGLPLLTNNMNNVPSINIFNTSNSQGEINSYPTYRKLRTNSVAKAYGINGEDIGEFGGNDPYPLNVGPNTPVCTGFVNTGLGNNSINIQAQVSFKAN